MRRFNALDWIAAVLAVIGGINWGLIGLFDFNAVDAIFGENSAMSKIIFILVGISALYLIYTITKWRTPSAHNPPHAQPS